MLYESRKIEQNDILAFTILNSSFNASILSLANLIKHDKQTINLYYLMDLMKKVDNLIDENEQYAFQKFSDQFEDIVLKQSATIGHVLILRDKVIAHIDKKHITDPSFFLEN
ncbi:MAG: hypothetical protein HY865_03575 [Chloroflexi bacterium]|nr:hypothetical protein [Chloroflexota bacterium]